MQLTSKTSLRWGLLEAFVAIQMMSGGLLFLPGAQRFRVLIRALPYVSSLACLFICIAQKKRRATPPPPAALIFVLILLALNLFHPTTNLPGGIAQCIFQLSIVAPAFWIATRVDDTDRLRRIIWILFVTNALSATLGLLQVYQPERFFPPAFSSVGIALNPDLLESLQYVGADGRVITRPPGLSDMPGGAAIAGMLTAFLGLLLGTRLRGRPIASCMCLALAGVGLTTLYFTQVRSLFLTMLLGIAAAVVVGSKHMQSRHKAALALGGAALVVGSFLFAVSTGGESVATRFLGLTEGGFLRTYDENRGAFVRSTFADMLVEYPFGAGLGRWGMMQVYFADREDEKSSPLWVEVQVTGWLLDGGVFMWLCYGSAIAISMRTAFRAARHPDPDLGELGTLVFALNLIVLAQSMAGPAFNNQLGIQFWTLGAACEALVWQFKRARSTPALNKHRTWNSANPRLSSYEFIPGR